MESIKIAVLIGIGFLTGWFAQGEIADRDRPAELGVRAWEWAEDYCRDYVGLADFRLVEMREAQAVCEQDDERAVRTLMR